MRVARSRPSGAARTALRGGAFVCVLLVIPLWFLFLLSRRTVQPSSAGAVQPSSLPPPPVARSPPLAKDAGGAAQHWLIPDDQETLGRFRAKLEFRRSALQARDVGKERIDQVLYVLTTPLEGPHCTAALIREVVRSAASLRSFCRRCDFDIVLSVDPEIHQFLMARENANFTLSVFDAVREFRPSSQNSKIFASGKPAAILEHSSRPFVIFMDADIFSAHRSFPEALFDQLHRSADLVMPYDWAHRHGEVRVTRGWGLTVPGVGPRSAWIVHLLHGVRQLGIGAARAREVARGDCVF
jgi:hypothetical protein